MNVAEYLRRRANLHYTLYIINAQGGFFVVAGKLVPEREFEKQNETPISLVTWRGNYVSEKRCSIDGRNSWLNVD